MVLQEEPPEELLSGGKSEGQLAKDAEAQLVEVSLNAVVGLTSPKTENSGFDSRAGCGGFG